ncbi:MAG TPA: glycosyl hydrolase family 28 protein [Verrucomicrobiae bacterium]
MKRAVQRNHFGTYAALTLSVAGLLVFDAAASAAPALPTNSIVNIVSVTNSAFGAKGDGVTTNTAAIQAAINFAAATNRSSGCTVEIPAGTFISGPLTLKSDVNLQIDGGATLQMLPMGSWPGTTTFISGSSIHDVEISGSGTIDGQGAAWWLAFNSNGVSRPNFIQFSSSSRILIQGVTLQNPPTFHIMIKNNNANITVQDITINTPGTSPNTDGFDIASTNVLIQNSYVSDGDDNIEIGGSQLAAEITVTNCTFGTGHGVSIGSITSGGVSNLTVINCTFNGTEYGLRLKSDNSGSGGGAGGLCQNLFYANIGMTNITVAPLVLYSYYEEIGTPTGITPQDAAAEPVPSPVPGTTVIWRNVVISNLTATAASGVIAGIIWGRTEMPVTNVILSHVNITASKSFDIYNASGVQFVDSQITLPPGSTTFELYDAQLTVTNSASAASPLTFDGLTTNGYGNSFFLYNAQASLKNTNVLDNGPLTISASTLAVSNNLTLFPSTALNYFLGTNAATISVISNLALGGTINVTGGAGFTSGVYTLLTYAGTLSGSLPALGSAPPDYNYSFDTNTTGQVNLIVTPPPPGIPTNFTALGTNLLIQLNWSASSNAAGYNLKRSTTNGGTYSLLASVAGTNYSDPAVNPGTTYYYVVSATNSAGESANSIQAGAIPLPSLVSINLNFQTSGNQLQLSWPQDHLGWQLQIQTNDLSGGIGTNWTDVPDANLTNQIFIPIDADNGSVFLRLTYP